MEAKDFLGNPLAVGDDVVFMQIRYRGLMKGKIVKLTPCTALIAHDRTNTCSAESRQDHGQIIKIMH